MKSFIVLSVTFVFLSLTALTAWSDGKETVDAKAVFETKCSACHNADRAKSIKKTQEAWTKTVMRMKGKKEGLISNDDSKIIINYLGTNYGK
jgi:cytochrome c5